MSPSRTCLALFGLALAGVVRAGPPADADRFGVPLPAGAVARLECARLRPFPTRRPGSARTLAVAFSPDGKRLLSAGEGLQLRSWDPASGDELPWEGEPLEGRSVAFAPDGKSVAVGDGDRFVVVYDAVPRKLRCTLDGGDRWGCRTFAFSPDGKAVATMGNDAVLRFWDADKGELVRKWEAPSRPVYYFAFSPDGKAVALGGPDGCVRLCDAGTGQERVKAEVAEQAVSQVAFSPDGKTLACFSPVRLHLLDGDTLKNGRRCAASCRR
jgi:WD40 repeat protein